MKKYLGIFSAVFALTAISFSCQKAEITDPNAPGTEQTYNKVDVVLTATLESRIGTKVTLDFPHLAWEDQDQIAVFDGKNTAPNVFTYQAPVVEDENTEETNPEEVTPAAVAVKSSVVRPSFSGSIVESAEELYAVYPYNANATLADGKITTTIPHEQVVPEGGNVDKSALLCVAKTTSDALAFKNVLGLVKVTVPSSMNNKFKEFTIRGANEEDVIAGTGAITVSQTPVFEATDAKTEVKLTHKSGAFPKGDYYIAVAPVKFANGFSIAFTKADGLSEVKSTDKANEVVRNSGLNVGDKLTEITWEYIIDSKEKLVAWNSGYKGWTKNDRVQLTADIDLDGVSWTPHDFPGTFEGNNHKIYNITISHDGYCGFVQYLSGTIQNLVLGSSDGIKHDGKSIFSYTPGAEAGSWVHMGSVASNMGGNALIKNVTNFVKLQTLDSDGEAKVCMGGIVSMGSMTETIENCTNHGEIICNASKGAYSTLSNHQLGGIISKTDGVTKVIGCKNYGNISASGQYVDNVGGIIANPNGNASNKYAKDKPEKDGQPLIKDCYNYGNITITKTTSEVTPMALGGIVGKLTGATVENCHNEGSISSVCDVLTGIGGVVGIHKLNYESKITGCSNGVQNATDKGILSFNPKNGTEQMVIGGILGYSEHGAAGKLTIQSSNNYAPIDVSYGNFRNIGGICGVVGDFTSSRDGQTSSVELLIDGCHNYGAITVTSATSYTTGKDPWQKHIGGVVGILYGSDAGVKISNSSNEAILHSTATGNGETRIAGIVAHTRYGNIEVSSCTNNGEVKTTDKATNARPAGIISVTNAATKLDVKQCYNKKTISSSATVGTFFAGGIVAYLLGPATISECYNQGEVTISAAGGESKIGGIAGQAENVTIEKSYNQNKVSFSASTKPRMGGIVGNIVQNVTIDNCHNDTDGVVECTVAGATTCVGGLVGRWSGQGTVIRNSSNSCAVNAKVSNQSQIVGGIVGVIEEGNATGNRNELITCTNSGKIDVTHGSTKDKYVRAGGVVGMIANKSVVKVNGCKNISTGVVSLSSENAATCHLGGIIAYTHPAVECTSNENNAAVSVTSKGNLYVGGIFGYDDALNSGYSRYDVSGNINTGDMSASTSGTTLSVGGLFGIVRKVAATNLKSDNTNYGNVTCAGGALAGSSSITWSGMVGTSVTVKGEAGAAPTPAATWLCPSGNVTGSYVTEQ